jgi:hypothetical protein
MLAAEYALVFHEGASGYTDRTHRMMTHLRQKRIALPPLRPILRIRYHTWDILSDNPSCTTEAVPDSTQILLPGFLAQAFRKETISTDEFAACWHHAVSQEENRLKEISELRSPRDLLLYLSRAERNGWGEKSREYEAARMQLLGVWEQAKAIQGRVYTLYDQVRRLRAEAADLERRKGDDYRSRVRPLQEQYQTELREGATESAARLQRQIDMLQADRAAGFDAEITNCRSQVRYALATVRELKARRLSLERNDVAAGARATLRRIEAEAEIARAGLVRNALQTIQGLPHTGNRPSAWWFPVVDPSGGWFRRLTETAEFYLESLDGDG